MSPRAGGLLVLAALAGGAVWWAWQAEPPPADPRVERARAAGREAQAICDAGRHDEAVERYLQAARLAEEAGDAALARALSAQAAVPLKLAGRLDEAREILLPVLEAARADGDRRSEGLALGNLARVEGLAGRDALALSYLDQLVEYARREGDARLEVWTLEQAAAAAGSQDDVDGALARIERALVLDGELSDEERRHDALLGQKAVLLAQRGDAEGAWRLWSGLPVSGASLANRAVSLARWDLHDQAVDYSWRAVQAFEAEGEARRAQRDQALLLHVGELIADGQLEAATARLDALLEAGGDDPALDGLRVLRARVALAGGRFGDAADELSDLLGRPGASDDMPLLAELTAVARLLAGDAAGALELVPGQDGALARSMLRAWALLGDPPGDALIGEAAPDFRVASWTPADRSLERLREACPVALPSPAVLALEIGLADSGRARESGNDDLAEALLRDAVREALLWQAADAMAAVPDLPVTDAAREVQRQLVEAWVDGRVPEGEAIIAVLGGQAGSYSVLMLPGRGPTTWSLLPLRTLEEQAARLVATLHEPEIAPVARASWEYFRSLVPRGAQADLAGASHWNLILPPGLACVPPGLLVTRDPAVGDEVDPTGVAWFVLDRSVSLLPHVPGPLAVDPPAGGGWLTMGAPTVDHEALPLSSAAWLSRFGLGVYNSGAPQPVEGGVVVAGPAATLPALRRALEGTSGLLLSGPGAGAGRFGGLVFSPDQSAERGDEAGGLLAFARMHALPLPRLVILDSTRFDPDDARYGPSWAATSVLARAHALLMTRWPVPVPMRDAVVRLVVEQRAQGLSLGRALASVQRDYLESMRAGDSAGAMHPQLWAAWLPYGLD